jgi:predicted PurR-regulated permease PerM
LEGWILTPWIQSGQTNLSAVTIILVVIIGGAVAGVLGMLLPIPVAACMKIFFEEVVCPFCGDGLRHIETIVLP